MKASTESKWARRLGLALAVFMLTSCQEVTRPTEPSAMPLEQARLVLSASDPRRVTRPPRTVDDVTALLSGSRRVSESELAEARRNSERVVSSDADAESLASFYYRRANAARAVGRSDQELEDYRRAASYAKSANIDMADQEKMFAQLFSAEERAGNLSRSIAALEYSYAAAAHPSVYPSQAVIRLSVLATEYAQAGDLDKAERALAEARRRFDDLDMDGWSSGGVAEVTMIVTMAGAEVLDAQGKFEQAQKGFARALRLWEPFKDDRRYGEQFDQPDLAARNQTWILRSYAKSLMRQGRVVEAEIYARQAVIAAVRESGHYSNLVAQNLERLTAVVFAQGRYADARKLANSVVDILEETGAPTDSFQLAKARKTVADTLVAQGRWNDAVREYTTIAEALADDPHTFERYFDANLNWALALLRAGAPERVVAKLQVPYERARRNLGDDHYDTAEIGGFLAAALAAVARRGAALEHFRRVVPVLLSRSPVEGSDLQTARHLRLSAIVQYYASLLWELSSEGSEQERRDFAAEAFRVSDADRRRAVDRALLATSVRGAIRDPDLAELARKEQAARLQIASHRRLLSNSLTAERGLRTRSTLRSRISRLTAARDALIEEISRRFPDYVSVIDPKPITLDAVRSVLRERESLVSVYVTQQRVLVWAVPKHGAVAFKSAPIAHGELDRMVYRLRSSLDIEAGSVGDIPRFDTTLAYELFELLLAPVEAQWKSSDSILLVSHRSLAQLPIAILPTQLPSHSVEAEPLFSHYRRVQWLARTHAVTELPSAASLVFLRRFTRTDAAPRAFAGFGDPWFDPIRAGSTYESAATSAVTTSAALALRASPRTRIMSRAGLESLPRLPETAREVAFIARVLGADLERDVFLGPSAKESTVKTIDLSDRRTVMFATHGLVSGDLDGLDQPALALSAPRIAGDGEDGLLTMGEILGLKLNAEMVVLSACNSGAADGEGAEAISGLGRAFFQAGARSLLVTHWPVETTSATALTTAFFETLADDPTVSRSGALRQAMVGLIDGPGYVEPDSGTAAFSYAHPIFWAPFAIVGEGTR